MNFDIKGSTRAISSIGNAYSMANTIIKKAGFNGLVSNGYRPSQWAKSNSSSALVEVRSNIGGFFADAIFNYDVSRSLQITSHPVQSGANISDHAFVQPRTIACELGISDSMANYVSAGYTEQTLTTDLKQALKTEASKSNRMSYLKNIFTQKSTTSNERKSKAALDLLIKIQSLRLPMTIVTPMGFKINNVLIEDMSWNEGSDSQYSIKINLTLKEVFVAAVTETKVATRPWSTAGTANKGEVQGVEERGSIIREAEDAMMGGNKQ